MRVLVLQVGQVQRPAIGKTKHRTGALLIGDGVLAPIAQHQRCADLIPDSVQIKKLYVQRHPARPRVDRQMRPSAEVARVRRRRPAAAVAKQRPPGLGHGIRSLAGTQLLCHRRRYESHRRKERDCQSYRYALRVRVHVDLLGRTDIERPLSLSDVPDIPRQTVTVASRHRLAALEAPFPGRNGASKLLDSLYMRHLSSISTVAMVTCEPSLSA